MKNKDKNENRVKGGMKTMDDREERGGKVDENYENWKGGEHRE